ncbi:MAG: aminotransferase class V-fold PLP-dependent enzyme [Clostridia bacterium]|nr:aminotransferase class V-fold PLP-dependent enzyme [Clostridia bacterium]
MKKQLALLGGKPIFDHQSEPDELFHWPIITEEDEQNCLDVIRRNKFSGTDITLAFQEEFAAWQGRKYALAFTNGTMSLSAAMFAVGVGMGDEIICPTKTYWGTVSQAINFGASAVFCNINERLSMDPDDLERCIGPRTKAIMVVHYFGYPADMDAIMPIARKHGLKVIEDVSHAHGALYKGRKVGTFGDCAAMSMMSWKAFAAGELGMLVTDDQKIYERALAYGHYERNNPKNITDPKLSKYPHIALGGVKGRANQLCCTLALGQLHHFDERMAEVNKAMQYFCDGIEDIQGLHPIRPEKGSGSTMGAWYLPQGTYRPGELGGLSSGRFAEAVRAETNGLHCWEGGNFCLHTHEFFKSFDFYGIGKPSRIAFADRDVREMDAACAPSEKMYCVSLPPFKKYMPEHIDRYIEAYRTVAENYEQLITENDQLNGGRWYGSENK